MKLSQKNGPAQRLYDKALTIDPYNSLTLYRRGQALYKLKRFSEAITSYERMLEYRPEHEQALVGLGNSLQQLGRYLEAKEYYGKALRINPVSYEALSNLGITLMHLNLIEDAIVSFSKAIGVNKFYPAAYINRGNALRLVNRHSEAKADFLQSIYSEPERITNYIQTALACEALGNNQEAIEFYREALKLPPKDNIDLLAKAVAYLRCGSWQAAFDSTSDLICSARSIIHEKFDSLPRYVENIRGLSKMYFIGHNSFKKQNTLMVAGNEDYIEKYFPKTKESFNDSASGINLHLHAYIANEEYIKVLKNMIDPSFTISYEFYEPTNKAGYTTRRFLRLTQLLNYLKKPILLLDIDSTVLRNLNGLFDGLRGADIGVYRRDEEIVLTQLRAAGFFYTAPNVRALRFLAFMVNYISHFDSNSNLTWFADQLALLAADLWFSRNGGVNIESLGRNLMSWTTPTDSTLIYTMKGASKLG